MLSMNQWDRVFTELEFDDEMWDWILEEAPKAGINHILMEVGDGIEYHSHPEISIKTHGAMEESIRNLLVAENVGLPLFPD